MKRLLIIAAALFAVAAPVEAGDKVILPNLYSAEYCKLRRAGLSVKDATAVAVRASLVSGQSVKVTYNGEQVDSDVLQATLAVAERCPSLL